jgi:enoyl-CoA hydratase
MTEQHESLVVTTQSRRVASIRINRPDRRNALTLEVKELLLRHLREADAEPSVSVIVLSGEGGNFVAGADVREMQAWTAQDVENPANWGWWQRVALIRKPIIAAVEGFALGGGCELLLASDTVVVAEDASIGLPEVRLGIMPGGGGTSRLVAAIGQARAVRLMMTGETISGRVAYEWGIASVLSRSGEALDDAMALANDIAQWSPIALQMIKDAVHNTAGMSEAAALTLERRNFALLFSTMGQEEGMAAFLEKRPPRNHGEALSG